MPIALKNVKPKGFSYLITIFATISKYTNLILYNMMKKYLKCSMALLALCTMVAGCKDDSFTQADANKHAEQVLGVSISSAQDWNMTTRLTASITVNLELDQNYTVVIYDENPLFNENATIYAEETAEEGKNTVFTFSIPSALKRVYVAAYDSKLRSVVQSANISGNVLKVYFGDTETAAAARRAKESDYTDSYARSLSDYLSVSVSSMQQYPAFTDNDVNQWKSDSNQGYTITASYYKQIAGYNEFDENGNWVRWVDGSSELTYFMNGDGKHYRIASGTEITVPVNLQGLDESYQPVFDGAILYVEGKLNLSSDNTLNGATIVVGSGGEVVLTGSVNMSNTGRFVVLGGGKITGSDEATLLVANGASCYNAGTINYKGELNVNGSDFYNNGTVNLTTLRDTSGGKITNFGKITAVDNAGAADAYNCEWINACYWKFTGNAGIGTLTMLDNSRLDIGGTAEFNQGTQTLYNNSVINAGILYVNSTTFMGTDNAKDNAIIKTGKIYFAGEMYINQDKDDKYQNENNTWVARKIDGKGTIYLDWDNAETYTKEGTKITDDNGYTMLSVVRAANYNYISEKTSAIRIPAGECTGDGYNPGGGGSTIIVGTPAVWSYAFEDSWIADYDMNDVVVKVQKSGSNKLKITLCCTGATYPLYVYYKTTPLFSGREVHQVLGAEGKFINTGDPSNEKFATCKAVTETINKPDDFDPNTFDIWIKSPEKAQIKLADQGEDPHAIMVPGDWKWPNEWTPITKAYPDFAGFAADATHATNTDWYDNCVESKVYKKQ